MRQKFNWVEFTRNQRSCWLNQNTWVLKSVGRGHFSFQNIWILIPATFCYQEQKYRKKFSKTIFIPLCFKETYAQGLLDKSKSKNFSCHIHNIFLYDREGERGGFEQIFCWETRNRLTLWAEPAKFQFLVCIHVMRRPCCVQNPQVLHNNRMQFQKKILLHCSVHHQ